MLRHVRDVFLPGLLVTLCSVVNGAEPVAITPTAPLKLDLASETTVVVAPLTPAYQQIATNLRTSLASITGKSPRLAPDSAAPADLGAGPVIVLGNLMDNALARRLYFEAYDFTDYVWPSVGGHVVRTIRDPLGSGAHVLMVGGSDVAGVADAAAALIGIVKEQGPSLIYVNRVKLGKLAESIQKYTADLLADTNKTWIRSGYSGSWEYQMQIARAALGYLRTGDENYLPLYARELATFFDMYVDHPKGDAPPQIHGFINTMLIPWDLVRDHPGFSESQRQKIDNDFLRLLRSKEGPLRIASEANKRQIRSNHSTRTGLDGFFGGRFFLRRFGLEEARQWMNVADQFFALQMESYKPGEDSWGHQWAASLFNTLVYFLAAGKYDYLQSPGFKLAAQRAMIAHPSGNMPLPYMQACATATGDTFYLSSAGYSEDKRAQIMAEMIKAGDEFLRAFHTGAPIVYRDDLLGVTEAPLDKLWYDTIDNIGAGGATFTRTVPYEECFDKISFREEWKRNDFYLLLDGISGGGHSYQDANCIVRYADRGGMWMGDTYTLSGSSTVRAQNGVYVAIDAAGPGKLHRAARKLYAGTSGDWWATGSALEGIGDVDWQRHILRRRGGWTLVLDRAVVKRPGEVLAERHWHIVGDITPLPDGLVSKHSGRELRLMTVGVPPEGMRGTGDRVETARASATPQQPLELASLLYVNTAKDKRKANLVRTALGWRIDEQGQSTLVTPAADSRGISVITKSGMAVIGQSPTLAVDYASAASAAPLGYPAMLPLRPSAPAPDLRWLEIQTDASEVTALALGEDGRIAAGNSQGAVRIFTADGQRKARIKFPGAILSLHFLGSDLLVGEERGAVTRLGADGKSKWEKVIPYVPMPWAYWSEHKSRIREIGSCDLDGDGKPEILLANSDRRLYALDGEGNERWKASVNWGILTGMSFGQYKGKPVVLGGTSKPAIFGNCTLYGADGKVAGWYTRPDLASWSNPSQFRDLRMADLDGDGVAEAISGVDTDLRQLVVYRQDGKIFWEADVAGSAEAVAVAPAALGRGASVLCASASGYVCRFDGASGHRQWSCFVGEPTHFVAPLPDGRVLAIARTGNIYVIEADGTLGGLQKLGAPITGLLRPGNHRDGNAVVLGTAEGRILVLRP